MLYLLFSASPGGLVLKAWIGRYAPHILVGLVLGTILAASYGALVYGPSPSSAPPKITWSPTSVRITFSATAGSSGLVGPVSFICSPGTPSIIRLVSLTNNPSKVSLSATPSSFNGCSSGNSSPNNVQLRARCVVSASQCIGTYSGTVNVQISGSYQNLVAKTPLSITIRVTA